MNLKNTKTAILLILIIGVILQTGQLWFGGSSNHNFFVGFTNIQNKYSDESYKTEPDAIYISTGNMRFYSVDAGVLLNDSNIPEIKRLSDGHISVLLKSGRYKETKALDWIELLDLKSVVYEYPVSISSDGFAKGFGESGKALKSNVSQFDCIVIKPARTSSEAMRIYFVDKAAGLSHLFELQRGISEPVSNEIEKLSGSRGSLYYISSIQSSLNFFNGNVFLPRFSSTSYSYYCLNATNAISEVAGIEKCVELFFENPVGIVSSIDQNGIPYFSDEETVVKYYSDTGVLEYAKYSVISKSDSTFQNVYAAALSFMSRDVTLTNKITLSDASFDNGVWKLYFDYELDGIKAYIMDETAESKTTPAIEVTIEGGSVTKYKRHAKRLAYSEEIQTLQKGFLEILDEILAEYGEETAELKLDNMSIGYYIEGNGSNGMVWIIESDDLDYTLVK